MDGEHFTDEAIRQAATLAEQVDADDDHECEFQHVTVRLTWPLVGVALLAGVVLGVRLARRAVRLSGREPGGAAG